MPKRIKSAFPKFLYVYNCKTQLKLPVKGASTEIAKHFNKHFCNIGKALADKVDFVNSYDNRSYLSDLILSSMFFCSTSDSEIINMINQFDLHKSCGSDGISAKFVIFAIYTIAQRWANRGSQAICSSSTSCLWLVAYVNYEDGRLRWLICPEGKTIFYRSLRLWEEDREIEKKL